MLGGLGVQGNMLSWGCSGAGGEPQANQERMGRTWCQEGPPGSATFSRDPHTECPACRFRQPHTAPELQGVPALACRETWSCHHHLPGVPCVPAPATSSNTVSPSLPSRAPWIGKESQCQLPGHRRVSGSSKWVWVLWGVCRGCCEQGVHMLRVCGGMPGSPSHQLQCQNSGLH